MIVNSSNISFQSERTYSKVESSYSEELISRADEAVSLQISKESKSLMEQMKEAKEERSKKENDRRQNNSNLPDEFLGKLKGNQKTEGFDLPITSEEKMQLELLKKILAALRGLQKGEVMDLTNSLTSLKSIEKNTSYQLKSESATKFNLNAQSLSLPAGNRGTEWKIQKVTSSFFAEQEATEFSSTGKVKTADGREINFGISIEMSRSFMSSAETYTEGTYYLKDPLVINLDSDVASVSDQKFYFDIDSDGALDEVSFLGGGSGFLALDKNGDGIINDGSELFGATSGDGFKDLAAFDKDSNGWIDEADDIFNHLKVWIKDDEGNNRLLNLKEADIGAIYLGYGDTQFSLNNKETNQTNAIIQKTGIYLKENGGVGTVQHIDLAV